MLGYNTSERIALPQQKPVLPCAYGWYCALLNLFILISNVVLTEAQKLDYILSALKGYLF